MSVALVESLFVGVTVLKTKQNHFRLNLQMGFWCTLIFLSSVKERIQRYGQKGSIRLGKIQIQTKREWNSGLNQCRWTGIYTDCIGTYVRHKQHGRPSWLLKLFTQPWMYMELAGWLSAGWHRWPISGPKPAYLKRHGVFFLGSLHTVIYSQSRTIIRAKSNLYEG